MTLVDDLYILAKKRRLRAINSRNSNLASFVAFTYLFCSPLVHINFEALTLPPLIEARISSEHLIALIVFHISKAIFKSLGSLSEYICKFLQFDLGGILSLSFIPKMFTSLFL